MYTLCIAEKPSVATDLGKVLGATRRNDGYLEGNGYLLTWALGHLVEFAEPEEYGYTPQKDIWANKENALNELPILPDKFKTNVIADKKQQFENIEKLMNRDDVDLIIDCGDMGPEGHYLQWLIREQVHCGKPVKRFCAASLTDGAIQKALNNLRDIKDFERIIEGEYCKHKADWVLGMSMSRCFSLKYGGRIDVGRVMSPTLYFVVKRYLDAQNFKPVEFYQIKADLKENFSVFLKEFSIGVGGAAAADFDTAWRLINKDAANRIVLDLQTEPNAFIKSIETKLRAVDRPQLYDITELQRDGNRVYNYGAADVLAAAQSLYELKILSYPRTDSRYLTSDLKEVLEQRIADLQTLEPYKQAAGIVLNQKAGLNIDGKIIDDGKVTDHYALIVTENIKSFDMGRLNETEKNILHLVISRMITAVAQKYVYEETTVEVICCGGRYILTANGKKPVQQGYKQVAVMLTGTEAPADNTAADKNEEQTFPNTSSGQAVHITNAVTVVKQTTAPKLHTEATLLTAMENAGTTLENGEVLKGRGIGTQATRAAIIQKLFDLGYIANKTAKKISYIEPTRLGINYIRVLPQELYSPKITADWETRIAAIVDGGNTSEQFMSEFQGFLDRMLREAKETNVEGVSFSNRESIGACPFCKDGDVLMAKGKSEKTGKEIDVYYCSLKCGFSLYQDSGGFFNNTERLLKQNQVKQLIENGRVTARTKYKDGAGKEKNGKFELMKSDKGKAYVRLVNK